MNATRKALHEPSDSIFQNNRKHAARHKRNVKPIADLSATLRGCLARSEDVGPKFSVKLGTCRQPQSPLLTL